MSLMIFLDLEEYTSSIFLDRIPGELD